MPTMGGTAGLYEGSEGTAHRAMAFLGDAGEIVVSRGRGAVVAEPDQS